MRRSRILATVCFVVLSFGSVLAEEQAPTAVPAKALRVLENMVGTWNVQGDPGEDGVALKGQSTVLWSPGRHYLLMNSRYKIGDIDAYDNGIIGWDGLSEDGIVIFRRAPIGFYETYRFKVVSETVNEGVMDGVGMGGTQKAKVRMVQQGDDKSTWYLTDQTADGQPLPDWKVVYTRVKTPSDEEELIALEHELAEAFGKRDIEVVNRLVADDMSIGLPEGAFVTKKDVLNFMRSDGFNVVSAVCEDLSPKVCGNMAVVTGKFKLTNKKGNSWQELSTDVFLKRDGLWRMVATHSSRVPDEEKATSKLSPEMKKLEGLVGDWAYEGEQMEPPVEGLPFGGAGTFSGKSTVRFVLDGAFQEGRFEDAAPGTAKGFGLTGYDPKKKCYVRHGYVDDGSQSISTATLDGHTWKIDSVTTTSKGDKVPVRVVEEYSSDWSSYTATVEASPDNGRTWKLWWKERGTKVKD